MPPSHHDTACFFIAVSYLVWMQPYTLTGYTATSWFGMCPASSDSLHMRLNVDQIVLSKDCFKLKKAFVKKYPRTCGQGLIITSAHQIREQSGQLVANTFSCMWQPLRWWSKLWLKLKERKTIWIGLDMNTDFIEYAHFYQWILPVAWKPTSLSLGCSCLS